MLSVFSCPLCAAPLTCRETGLLCPAGHCFDRAREGYVDLLPVNHKHSKTPGDDRAMVAARSAFLDKGHYAPLRDALCQMALACTAGCAAPLVLDSGCGEGYYTQGLYRALEEDGRTPRLAGVDISKFALRKAGRRLPQGEFAVASVYRLPLRDSCADLLIDIFSPLAADGFSRVIKPGGHFIYAVPAPRHLWQMKQVLYEEPYENPVKREEYGGFAWREVRQVRYTIALASPEDIAALFQMTPYAWKTPRKGVERLRALDSLEVEIGFDLHCYQRIGG